jgi:hypothetical protein
MAMKLLNRDEFSRHWENIMPGLGGEGSTLWIYEEEQGAECQWFVSIGPIHNWDEMIQSNNPNKDSFWQWVGRNCQGCVLCYSSNAEEEWWGFTDKDDIVPWVLKWT